MTEITRRSVVALEHRRCSSPDKWRSSAYLLALTSLYNPPLLRLLSGEQRCLVFLGYVEDTYYLMMVVLFVSFFSLDASTPITILLSCSIYLTSLTFKINIFHCRCRI